MILPFKISYDILSYECFPDTKEVICTIVVFDNYWCQREPRIFSGIGEAKNGDSYDEEIGKKVALAKAEKKAYKFYKHHLTEAYKMCLEDLENFKCAIGKCERIIEHNSEYIKKF